MALAMGVILLTSPTTSHAYKTLGAYKYCDGPCPGSTNNTNTGNNTGNGNNFNPNVLDKNGAPTIYSTNPEEVFTNDNTKTITIYGTGFKPESIARWNSQDRPTTFVSANELRIRLDEGDTKTPGKYLITVVNPDSEGGKFSNPKIVNVKEGKSTGAVKGTTTTTKPQTTKTNAVVKKTTTTTNNNAVVKKEEPKKVAVAENTNCLATTTNGGGDSNGKFTASAVNGGNGFMPTSFVGWLMLFVLIFLSVLLFRKLWVTDRDINQPLKHA